ncbi:MAG: hypothetical protein ACRC9R_05565 [Enterovibrio sp.]
MSKLSKFAFIASLFAAISLPFFASAEEEMPAEEAVMAGDGNHDAVHGVIYAPTEDDASAQEPIVDQEGPLADEVAPEEYDEVPME